MSFKSPVRTLPWSWYSDPEIAARETDLIFRRTWHYVGHRGSFANGSVTPTTINREPVIVTVDDDGERRAFANVCRHRGSVLCEAAAETEFLRCPYHAWTYGLDGSLRAAPRSGREDGFDPAEHGLWQLPIDSWGPFVFVALDDNVSALAEALGDLPEKIAEIIDVDSLVFLKRESTDYVANWKVCVENFLECYHCRVAHPGFAAVIETGPDDYRLETSPTFSSQYGPIRDGWSGPFDPSGPIGRGQFHFLFPNLTINVMPGYPNLSVGPVTPTSPTTTHRFLDYFTGPGVDGAWIEEMVAFDDQVGEEDRYLVESVQRGMEARPHDHGTLFVDSERLIAHFIDQLKARLI